MRNPRTVLLFGAASRVARTYPSGCHNLRATCLNSEQVTQRLQQLQGKPVKALSLTKAADRHVADIIEIINRGGKLQDFALYKPDFTRGSTAAIVDALSNATSLSRVIYNGVVDGPTAEQMATLIASQDNLRYLGFDGIGKVAAGILLAAMRERNNLLYVSLRNNALPPEIFPDIRRLLQNNPHLARLDIRGSTITPSVRKEMAAYFASRELNGEQGDLLLITDAIDQKKKSTPKYTW